MIRLVRCLAVLLPCLVSWPAAAAPSGAAAEETAVYLVQLEGAPLARSAAVSASSGGPRKLALDSVESLRAQERLRLRQDESLAAIGGALAREVAPLHRYSVVLNGLALELTEREAAALARMPEVKRVQRGARYQISSDAGPAWTGAPGIWNGTATGGLPGTKGEGMIIGVIDTGISLDHPSFADVGGDGHDHVNPRGAGNYVGWCDPSNPDHDPTLACNDKLIGVWSYPEAGGDPRDDNGHGTHTASIAAGNHRTVSVPGTSLTRQISGVAPHASLIAYDTCNSSGACFNWLVAAAVDQAVADGVDVLNLSFSTGAVSPWGDLVSTALLEAQGAGVFVAAALRDNGSETGSPGNAPWVLAVGASSHDRRFNSSLVGTGGGSSPFPNLPGKSLTPAYGPVAIVRGSAFGDHDCSEPFPPGTFNGKIVVCEHDSSDSEAEQHQNVLAGGAGGLVVSDLMNELSNLTTYGLPWIYLTGNSTLTLSSWVGSGSGHTARIGETTAVSDPANADRLWTRSPHGRIDNYDIMKPNVTAPGVEILAAHTDSGGARILSGTSMAAAHAAGAAALLMDLHPDWTPSEVQSALQTTAVGVARLPGQPAEALEVGSGRLNLGAAARAGLVLPVTLAEFEAASPVRRGSPRALNLPSLMEDKCMLSCGWTRTVRSTLSTASTWNVTVEAPNGVTLTVTPSSFTLGPGGTQTLQITASGPPGPLTLPFGQILLTESGAQAPAARLPVVLYWAEARQLTILKGGSGSGVVTSNPPGIDCGSTCSANFPDDTFVTVTATPSPGSVFAGWSGQCYGPQPTCTVRMTNPWTFTAYFNPATPDKPLTNHTPVKDSIQGPIIGGTWNYYFFDVGSGNKELVVDLLDMGGDAALYVKFGDRPGISGGGNCVDHSSATNNRRCVILNPQAGRWWVGVSIQDENVAIQYTIRASRGNTTDRELANRSSYGDFLSAQSLGAAWKYYFVDLPAGSTDLSVDLARLSADADLYVRFGAKPDRTNHDCASTEPSTLPDGCSIPDPAAGRWWIGVNNFSIDTISHVLKASWQTVDTPADFYTVTPCRVLDTRTGAQPLISGVARTIQLTGLCGIPETARAVSANVTITGGTGAGSLVLHPGDEGIPSTSTLNFPAGQTRANNILLKLDGGGTGTLGAQATVSGPGQVHVVVDVNGYFE